MRTHPWLVAAGVGAAAFATGLRPAQATTYQVGPGQQFTELTQVAGMLEAGDIVEVAGDHTYAAVEFRSGGSPGSPVTVRGVAVGGKLPVVAGSDYTVMLTGNHFVLENVEVTGGTAVCVLHKADDITLRSVRVHDCPGHGILGTDAESGSITIEYSEVWNTGEGDRRHQLYIATDETMYPGSVFRLQHSYIHDGNGGNNVKSRAERTEIYYNWIEEAAFHELDLIGPDGQDEGLAREDSDVVGNVLIKTSEYQIARIGSDGTGETRGRYRFVANTMLMAGDNDLAIRLTDGVDGLELHNNVILSRGGGPVRVIRDDAVWVAGRAVSGVNNWVASGSEIPEEFTGTIEGGDPGFENLAMLDLRPKESSALVDAAGSGASPAGHDFPAPEALPLFLPPFGVPEAPGEAEPRPSAGSALDIGAFEFGTGPPVQRPPDGGPGPGPGPGGGDGGPGGGDDSTSGGCGCRAGGVPVTSGASGLAGAALLLLALLGAARRRRSSTP